MTHEVKTWPEWFEATRAGRKMFDVRIDDRDGAYALGDMLWQREWNPETEEYTGREEKYAITYVLSGDEDNALVSRGIEPGYVVLGLQ